METDLELLRCATMAMIFHCEQYDKDNSILPELKKHRNTITMMIEACEGKADSTSEKDLRACEVSGSVFRLQNKMCVTCQYAQFGKSHSPCSLCFKKSHYSKSLNYD